MFSLLKSIPLRFRAYKYKIKSDKGGIAFILREVNTGNTVFDIGAHKGGYLFHLRNKAGSSGKIIGFEPQPGLFDYLNKMKRMLHWDNVTIENIALSNTTEDAEFYIPFNKKSGGSSPGASLLQNQSSNEYQSIHNVKTDTLDNYCTSRHIRPDLLKIDVEGNELKLFQGGIEVLRKYHPKIIVEIESRHVGEKVATETFEFLASLGYKGFFYIEEALIPIDEFSFIENQNINNKNNYSNNFIFI